ncbi:MAG: HAMP domain-containing sensor histidine kinase [Candidatus Gastranaerophilales bacterium]|nr:HAMP domain-containing sensor histidine kinase [Candidatus Gastranaerophilales bacterium]
MKKQKNTLKSFILNGSSKECSKQTIVGLFRSIVEPLVEAPSQDGFIAFRLLDTKGMEASIKRLEFSNAKIYSFNDTLTSNKIINVEKEKIWENIEFILVLAPRYSAVLVWDYSDSQLQNFSQICLIFNSRSVGDVAKAIFENANIPLDEYLANFAPDRRENELLNVSINKIVGCLNSVNEEMRINQAEKDDLAKSEKKLLKYEYSSDNAKFIAHEIKNHLSIIDLYTKIMEKRFEKISCDSQTIESIQNSAKNIKNATYSITQFIEELKYNAKPILVEKKLIPVVEEAINLSTAKAEEKNIKIDAIFKEEARIHIDEVKFQSVLLNVLYNAIEALQKGGKITVSFEGKINNMAQIIITDNGEGIPEEIQDKIFEKGFTTKITGSGLGLYNCQTMMKEQYGTINLLKSDVNGTSWELLIPTI